MLQMMYYKRQTFTDISYGIDKKQTWFERDKVQLRARNGCINLPYIVDGDTVVTQSNTCALYVSAPLVQHARG